jgi:hypothetical protein
MSVVIKKIKNKEYAYVAYRSEGRVVQRYLGALSNPEVRKRIELHERENRVPENFFYLFWDTSPSEIDIRKNSRYIIERVLELGGLNALYWIQKLYPTRLIMETLEVSRKLSDKSRNFWRIWFGYSS